MERVVCLRFCHYLLAEWVPNIRIVVLCLCVFIFIPLHLFIYIYVSLEIHLAFELRIFRFSVFIGGNDDAKDKTMLVNKYASLGKVW